MHTDISQGAESRRESIEQLIRNHVARATDCAAAALDGCSGLAAAGLDSLGAQELKSSLQEQTGADLSLSDLFSAPSITVLACRVADLASGSSGAPAAADDQRGPGWEEGSL
jgi:aryl carrier-like protein